MKDGFFLKKEEIETIIKINNLFINNFKINYIKFSLKFFLKYNILIFIFLIKYFINLLKIKY